MQVTNTLARMSLVAACAAFLSAGAVLAQDENQSTETEDAAEPSTAGELSTGETVDENEVLVGQTYPIETNEAWEVRCFKTESGQDPCEMYQLLNDVQGTPIAEIMMFELPESQEAAAGATVVVPLETALLQQLTIQVDDNPAKRYPFAFCDPVGCHARIGLTADEVLAFRRGAEAQVSIVPMRAPDQRVVVTMSLSGFTASYDKVSELNGT